MVLLYSTDNETGYVIVPNIKKRWSGVASGIIGYFEDGELISISVVKSRTTVDLGKIYHSPVDSHEFSKFKRGLLDEIFTREPKFNTIKKLPSFIP